MNGYWEATGAVKNIDKIAMCVQQCYNCGYSIDHCIPTMYVEYMWSDNDSDVEWFCMCGRCFVAHNRRIRERVDV